MRRSVRLRLMLLAATLLALAALPAAPVPAHATRIRQTPRTVTCTSPGTPLYLHTCGPYIEDYRGQPVRLIAVNWYGFESNDFVAGGLDRRSYRDIIATIKALGFNTIRIPFSNEMVETNPVVSDLRRICPLGEPRLACRSIDGRRLLAANPDLIGQSSLQILKTIADYAGSQGLYVILDDHRSRAGWAGQENGLWYDAAHGFSQTSWIDDWKHLMFLFLNDSALTGVDLFNEPHSFGNPTSCAAYLTGHGASWGTCDGQSNPDTDWHAAATLAGNTILSMNPNLLVVVEGTTITPNQTGGFDPTSYGTNLAAAVTQPVRLDVPNRLVYSVHEYRWDQGNADLPTMVDRWTRMFGYLMNPSAPYATPVWVGEFGTCTTLPICISDTTPGSHGYWFDALIRYLNTPPYPDAPPFNWSWWPLNGTSPDAYDFVKHRWDRRNGDPEPYGLLTPDWTAYNLPGLQAALFSSAQLPATPTPLPTATVTPTATMTPTETPTVSPTATPTVAQAPRAIGLAVQATGMLNGGQVHFTLQAHRDRPAHLSGAFPYIDRSRHLTLQAQRFDSVSVRCAPLRQVQVLGLVRDGQRHTYHIALAITAAPHGRLAVAIHVSSGYALHGLATGTLALPCPASPTPTTTGSPIPTPSPSPTASPTAIPSWP